MGTIKRNLDSLKYIFRKNANRKKLIPLVLDILKWMKKSKGGLIYFPLFHLEEKTFRVSDYISTPQFDKIHDQLNMKYYRPVLEDKLIFDRVITSFQINTPETIAVVENDSVFWLATKKLENIELILKNDLHVFVKKITSWGGYNVFKLDIENNLIKINNTASTFDNLMSHFGKAKYVLQKTIVQHENLSKLNPNSVNTIRINTINSGDSIRVFSYFLRIGKGKSVVDNISSGNLYTGIKDTGQLYDYAIQEKNVPVYLHEHPDTKCKINTVVLPFWEEAKKMCVKAHQCLDYFFIIGWDIAITENGPVMIEGNPVGELYCQQALYGGLKKEFLEAAKQFKTKKLPYIEPN